MKQADTVRVCILSSTSYGHVEEGFARRAWAVRSSEVGGVECRAGHLVSGTPCLFYVSSSKLWGDGFFCGPATIARPPNDDFARSLRQSAVFREDCEWRHGFPIEPLAPNVKIRMTMEDIRRLRCVRDRGGNCSQALHLAGRYVFLPCELPIEDIETILEKTGAVAEALHVWASFGTRRSNIPSWWRQRVFN